MLKRILLALIVLPPLAYADGPTHEEFFNVAKQTVQEMGQRGELGSESPRQVLTKYLVQKKMFLVCEDRPYPALVYHECVVVHQTRTHGLQDRAVDFAAGAVASHYADRLIQSVEDRVVRGFKEIRDRTERQMRADRERQLAERRRGERDERCAFSANSTNTADC